MRIEQVRISDLLGRGVVQLAPGEGAELSFDFQVTNPAADAPIAVFGIYADDDTPCFETHSAIGDVAIDTSAGSGSVALQIERLDLAPGDYRVTVGLFSADWSTVYDYHAEAYPLRIAGAGPSKGHLNPPVRWSASAAPGLGR